MIIDLTGKGVGKMAEIMDMKKLYRHILWMLRNMPNKEDNPRKWNRWLGFLQGLCFNEGLLSIAELKLANKSSLMIGFDLVSMALTAEARMVFRHPEPYSLDDHVKRWEDSSDDNSG